MYMYTPTPPPTHTLSHTHTRTSTQVFGHEQRAGRWKVCGQSMPPLSPTTHILLIHM